MGDGRGFRHTIALADQDAGQGSEAAGKFRSERRSTRFHPVQTVFLGKLSSFCRLGQRIQSGRNRRHRGDALADEQSQQLGHIKTRHKQQRRTQD